MQQPGQAATEPVWEAWEAVFLVSDTGSDAGCLFVVLLPVVHL